MKKVVYPILLSLWFLIVSACNKNPNSQEILSDTSENQLKEEERASNIPNLNKGFTIANNTGFNVDILFDGEVERFQNPSSKDFLFIGKDPVQFLDERYFCIGNKVLEFKSDTVVMVTSDISRLGVIKLPDIFLNFKYPEKYKNKGDYFHSKKFGEVRLYSNGLSCDDSYSGVVKIKNSDDFLSIAGLANLDLFESTSGDLFIVSYHNCLLTNLKIIRVH